MRIAVTGGSGFLGSKFLEVYADKFDHVVALNSRNSPLSDFDKLLSNTKDVDILIHTAFDHSYKDNIIGIKNILKVCRKNKIKKIIHMSTFSVYDPNIEGVLNEDCKYSNLNDPYSKEKIEIEGEIERYKGTGLDIMILQPTIVYGLGGNWTKYALHACKSNFFSLPNCGNDICNPVYISDVVNAIYRSCISKYKFEKIIISSNENITWKEFYKEHCKILDNFGLPSNCNIINSSNQNEFHSNYLVNIGFILWYRTPLGRVLNLFIGILKRIRERNYTKISSDKGLKIFLRSKIDEEGMSPLGITKKMHNCKISIDTSNAKTVIGYKSKFSFAKGIYSVSENIKGVLK